MVHEDLKPRDIMTPGAFRNAIAAVLGVAARSTHQAPPGDRDRGQNGVDVYGLCEEMSDVPVLCAVRPTGDDGSSIRGPPAARGRCSSASSRYRHRALT